MVTSSFELDALYVVGGKEEIKDAQFSILNPNYVLVLTSCSRLYLCNMNADIRLDYAEKIFYLDTLKA